MNDSSRKVNTCQIDQRTASKLQSQKEHAEKQKHIASKQQEKFEIMTLGALREVKELREKSDKVEEDMKDLKMKYKQDNEKYTEKMKEQAAEIEKLKEECTKYKQQILYLQNQQTTLKQEIEKQYKSNKITPCEQNKYEEYVHITTANPKSQSKSCKMLFDKESNMSLDEKLLHQMYLLEKVGGKYDKFSHTICLKDKKHCKTQEQDVTFLNDEANISKKNTQEKLCKSEIDMLKDIINNKDTLLNILMDKNQQNVARMNVLWEENKNFIKEIEGLNQTLERLKTKGEYKKEKMVKTKTMQKGKKEFQNLAKVDTTAQYSTGNEEKFQDCALYGTTKEHEGKKTIGSKDKCTKEKQKAREELNYRQDQNEEKPQSDQQKELLENHQVSQRFDINADYFSENEELKQKIDELEETKKELLYHIKTLEEQKANEK